MAAKTLIASKKLEIRLIDKETLMDLYQRATCSTQRDHVKRAPTSRYLHGKLWGLQLVFQAVRNAGGKIELIDGYTRCECLMRGLSHVGENESIVLHVHDVDGDGEVKGLYDQCDNPNASKKAPDRLDEGLRLTGKLGKFTSQLMSRGPRASAVSTSAGGRPVREAVELMIDGMCFVDHMGLTRTIESSSLLALYITIGKHAARFEEADEFIRIMNGTVYDPRELTRYTAPVKAFHDLYLDKKLKKSLSGAGNVEAILQLGLGAFTAYLSKNHIVKIDSALGEPVTLGSFVEAMAATR